MTNIPQPQTQSNPVGWHEHSNGLDLLLLSLLYSIPQINDLCRKKPEIFWVMLIYPNINYIELISIIFLVPVINTLRDDFKKCKTWELVPTGEGGGGVMVKSKLQIFSNVGH